MKEENRCHEMLRCSSKVRFEINLNGFHKGADKVEKKKKIIIQSTWKSESYSRDFTLPLTGFIVFQGLLGKYLFSLFLVKAI